VSSAGSGGSLRSLPVPEGLDGERVDAALSRMFGLSRTKAAELAGDGRVAKSISRYRGVRLKRTKNYAQNMESKGD